MNLLLTCATIPEFSPEALDPWNRFCIAEYIQGDELIRYLLFASSSEFASIGAIVFLSPTTSVGFIQSTDGRLSPIPWTVWEGDFLNAELAERIRNLPESCAMRDGRKWKRIPQVVLSTDWHRPAAYDGLDVEFVVDTTEHMLHSGYSSPYTWNQIERIVNAYHQKAMSEYARVGFLVTDECGLYRVKRASRKKHSDESEFYFGGKDKRRFRGFVTIARERDGVMTLPGHVVTTTTSHQGSRISLMKDLSSEWVFSVSQKGITGQALGGIWDTGCVTQCGTDRCR